VIKVLFLTAAAIAVITFASSLLSTITAEPLMMLGVLFALGLMADH
jgi:hypothetical protein